MKITAAVALAPDRPFELISCDLSDELASGEVLVRIEACGICHTDLAVKLQHIPVPLPKILGHEGAGVIERIGPGVVGLVEGDHVLMSFGSCGACGQCQLGAPGYCDEFGMINLFGQRRGGSGLRYRGAELGGSFFAQSAFATHAIATVRNVVKIDKDLPLELLAPLGCGIQTGAGAVLNVLAPRAGASIAVFGVGAVGMAGIMAARLAGCSAIVAVDVRAERLARAREIGATHTIDGRTPDLAKVVAALGKGRGVDHSLDTTGVPDVVAASIGCLRQRGSSAQVAAPPRGTRFPVEASVLVGGGLTVRGVVEGDAVPSIFLPRLIDFFRQGQLPLDRIVNVYPFEEINRAIEDMETGATVKPVLRMN
ncbi:NAD(P)-dependent alcohol dehydrogenase [Bradyrhizobium liaoningense]|uniref:NAD(P)-dependent alcohol dehydrogenase n=1 Tax=Bradyrhizobium liaoningense TaxID=43992 RepID=UPI001BA5F398|nr:NAD(P)-dependent alcohol dehydrogenase [Bradyrhizobium liaoningense]MBR0854486.1 NAD(P)-dependent alcohol dehydrogenase [Bradyrhizobium liaoningense]